MKDNKASAELNTVDGMIAYMSAKYEDQFEYTDNFGDFGTDSTKCIIVTSAKYPGNEISVCYHEKDGEGYITENYTQLRFLSETEAFVEELMKDIFGTDVYASCSVSSQGTRNTFDAETTFEEFIAQREANISFGVVVSNEFAVNDMETITEKVKMAVADSALVASGEILFASSDNVFRPYDDLKFFEKEELHGIYFDMDGKNNFSKSKWW